MDEDDRCSGTGSLHSWVLKRWTSVSADTNGDSALHPGFLQCEVQVLFGHDHTIKCWRFHLWHFCFQLNRQKVSLDKTHVTREASPTPFLSVPRPGAFWVNMKWSNEKWLRRSVLPFWKGFVGWGSWKRRSPTGGWAKGMPRNWSTWASGPRWVEMIRPLTTPCCVFTCTQSDVTYWPAGTVWHDM